jgi:hypothetical protein
MNKFIKRIFDKLFPKSEIEKIQDEISKLKVSPSNYGKVAFMYLKLSNIYRVLIGKGEDDSICFIWADVCHKQYQLYRELYLKQHITIKQ